MIPWLAGWMVVLGAAVPVPTARFDPPPAPAVASAVAPPADRWIAEDKARHFAMSFAAASMAYGAARLVMDPVPARSAAAGAAVILGIGKEIRDARSGGPFSLKDLAWDAAGVALGFTLAQRID